MTDLFETIRQEQPKIPGWCSQEKAIALASIVVALRPAISVEIGIYGGSSLIPILLAHQWCGLGVVYGIEPWSKEEAMKAQTNPTDVQWWGAQDYDKLHRDFMALIQRLGVSDLLRLHRSPSRFVQPPPGIGLLHIDGAHDNVAIEDVVRFAPQVVVGGIVVMDDLNWSGGAVTRAALRLEQLGCRFLYPIGTGAIYQKTR
jgi:predicted O-methyltransferase YrrM